MSPDRGCRNKKMRGVSRDIMGEELAGLKLEREREGDVKRLLGRYS